MNKRSEGGGSVKIDLRQNKQVYLKFPDSDTCLIEWLSSISSTESEPDYKLQKDFEPVELRATRLEESRRDGKGIKSREDIRKEERQIRRIVIQALHKLSKDKVTLVAGILLEPIEYRSLPKSEPNRSISLVHCFENEGKLDALKHYLEDQYPELMQKISEDVEIDS